MIDINKRYGIRDYGSAVGDSIIKTSFPENFFLNYNQKVIDVEKKWIFDHNPYVERDQKPDQVLCFLRDQVNIIHQGQRLPHLSHAAEYCYNYSLPKCFLRRPRLYIYEDSETVKNQVTVHVKGNTAGMMPEEVRKQISKNYVDYNIIQIGVPDEPMIEGAQDARGLALWDTVKIIASSAIFIGVNSGFHHISKAYPKVRSKLILEVDEGKLERFYPLNYNDSFEWFEYGVEYYNKFTQDIGITDSYIKI